jgi:hypothetical protein
MKKRGRGEANGVFIYKNVVPWEKDIDDNSNGKFHFFD